MREAGKDGLAKASEDVKALLTTMEVEAMQNLIQNRRLIVGMVVAILVAAAIVLLIAYSGGGGGAGGYH